MSWLQGAVNALGQGLEGQDRVKPVMPPPCSKKAYTGISQHTIIHHDFYAYCAWPSIIRCRDGQILIAFSKAMRHQEKITHSDPSFQNVIVRSTDGGATWSPFPEVVGDYRYYGRDNPGIAELSDGKVLVNAYWPLYAPVAQVERRTDARFFRTQPFPWARATGRGRTLVFHSTDQGKTWLEPVHVDVSPFRSGWQTRPVVELSNGTLLLPCYEEEYGPPPSGEGMTFSAFLMRSKDRGLTWREPTLIAGHGEVGFNEPAIVSLPSGKLTALLRTAPVGVLYQSDSEDEGHTWSKARKTPMWGYPSDLRVLQDGRLLATYGHRRPPFGIRACLSRDEGKTWDIAKEIVLRDDFKNDDLGYPTTTQLEDGTLLTTYYGRDENNDATCIQGTFWKLLS
ncbi:MAG: sialidase family protein [Acidobacteriota bacterium]